MAELGRQLCLVQKHLAEVWFVLELVLHRLEDDEFVEASRTPRDGQPHSRTATLPQLGQNAEFAAEIAHGCPLLHGRIGPGCRGAATPDDRPLLRDPLAPS